MKLSLECRIFLVEETFRNGGQYNEDVKQQFRIRFPDVDVPHRNSVANLIKKFRKYGSVENAPKSGRPTVLTEQKFLAIAESMANNPKKPIRKLAQEQGLSYGSARKSLNTLKILKKLSDVPHDTQNGETISCQLLQESKNPKKGRK